MKTEYPKQESVREEVTTVRRSFWASGQPGSEFLTNAVKVATVLAAFWGIACSVVSGLENRLIDRIDSSHRELSAQIEGVDCERSAQIEGLERSMVEGFKQSHQRMDRMDERMDRMDERMDRMDGRMERIESDIDAIEKHLYRIGAVDGSEEAPAAGAPAVAKPHRSVSSMGAVQSSNESATPPSDEGKSLRWTDAAPHIAGQDSLGDLGSSGDTLPVDR